MKNPRQTKAEREVVEILNGTTEFAERAAQYAKQAELDAAEACRHKAQIHRTYGLWCPPASAR